MDLTRNENLIESPLPTSDKKLNDDGQENVKNPTGNCRILRSSLTSEHGLDATRMWQPGRLHASRMAPSGVIRLDADWVA